MGLTRKLLLWTLAALVLPIPNQAGPPFVTDDPEPVEYRHWEVYLSSQLYHDDYGWTGTVPQTEINYGVVPNLQLHVMFSNDFTATSSTASAVGFGDIELGAKYRFIQQNRFLPDVAFYPLVEVPTASRSRGLGDGHTQYFLPLWTEKDFGKWTVNIGGGYYINPGKDNLNWWFMGAMLQRKITDHVALGAEVFHQTVQAKGGNSTLCKGVMDGSLTWESSSRLVPKRERQARRLKITRK
jgi:hypothetical protein